VFTWRDGSTYEGFWEGGKKTGVGVFRPAPHTPGAAPGSDPVARSRSIPGVLPGRPVARAIEGVVDAAGDLAFAAAAAAAHGASAAASAAGMGLGGASPPRRSPMGSPLAGDAPLDSPLAAGAAHRRDRLGSGKRRLDQLLPPPLGLHWHLQLLRHSLSQPSEQAHDRDASLRSGGRRKARDSPPISAPPAHPPVPCADAFGRSASGGHAGGAGDQLVYVCQYDRGKLVHEEALSTQDLELIFGPAKVPRGCCAPVLGRPLAPCRGCCRVRGCGVLARHSMDPPPLSKHQ
jgi:hypothetical protein